MAVFICFVAYDWGQMYCIFACSNCMFCLSEVQQMPRTWWLKVLG